MAVETLKTLRSRYIWDETSLRYRSPRGRFVSARALKQSLNSYVRRSQKEIRRIASQVASGSLDVAEWQRLTANLVKSTHLASAALAKGGWAQMTKADFGRVGQGLRFHYERLARFAAEVESGRLAPGTIQMRAGMYAASAGGVYENTRRDAAADVFTEERRVLGAAEHCPDCIEEAAKGWAPVGTLRKITDSACRTNCRCRFLFRN